MEISDQDGKENHSEYAKVRAALEKRCRDADTKCDPLEYEEEEYDEPSLVVEMRRGREAREILLQDVQDIKEFLAVPFERYIFLGDYEAVCCYEENSIEAGVRPVPPVKTLFLYRRLLGQHIDDAALIKGENISLELKRSVPPSNQRITIGPASTILNTLCQSSPPLSLKIDGIQVARHDDAVDLLERIADSLFFQIDFLLNLLLVLIRRPTRFHWPKLNLRTKPELQFPRSEYDKPPMALYMYARSAVGMPLLQYLAYYQAIEFYFPVYSEAEARRKVRSIIKNPSFREERDLDIGRILTSLRSGLSGFGNELSQLKATLQECIDQNELRKFVTADPEREKFFSSKQKTLTHYQIPIANSTADLRNHVADRIYDIRCKIVHTKSDRPEGEVRPILPFSRSADLLYHDIELIQYIARQVLVFASTSLRI